MPYSKQELADYRLQKARETLEEAKLLASEGHWSTTASRLYYACFYAASSYLILYDVKASTHSGVKTAFSKELIKSGKLSLNQGQLYIQLFTLRHDADYIDFKKFTQSEIEPLIPLVAALLDDLEHLITQEK